MTEVTFSQLKAVRDALRPGSTVSVDDPVSVAIIDRMLEAGFGRGTPMWERREQEAFTSVSGKVRRPTPASDQEKEWARLMFKLRMYNELGDLAARFCEETVAYQSYADRARLAHCFKGGSHPLYWTPLLKDFCDHYGISEQ